MFSRMQLISVPGEIARHFGVGMMEPGRFIPSEVISAFDHLPHPVITTANPLVAHCGYTWGLIPPDWRKSPDAIQNHTISAKLEYLTRRYAWKNVTQNRCLVPANAYFEYHWNDPKGKSKTRYTVRNSDADLFALAGLYSQWSNGAETLYTFAICTTVGNEIMEFVHNKDAAKNYFRMPVMLNAGDERQWLDTGNDYMDFAYPNYRPKLFAEPEIDGMQGVLF